MPTNIVIRADASPSIGTGHVMRCLALAQALQDEGGAVTFVMRDPDASVVKRLEREKITIREISGGEDAEVTAQVARRSAAQWVVVDGYTFDFAYQQAIQSAGLPLLFVDDYGHCTEYTGELLLNQNISADEGWYAKRSPRTRLLLGMDYALLRREFRQRAPTRTAFPQVARNVLITLGGADTNNITALALTAVARLKTRELAVKVAVGPLNPHGPELQATLTRLGLHGELVSTTTGMPELMQWADVAISATGSTCWELLFMQTPFVGISLADNQRPTARRLDELGVATTLDFTLELSADDIAQALEKLVDDPQKRAMAARRGRGRVDGKGALRVIEAMREAVG